MPEIKNNFSQGKINQDLDERILPKGQYRDALNIQVSTSEESGVGALQNVLGNTRVENVIGGGWNTVGTIADEKNNKLYWLVHNPNRDAIFEYNLEDNTTVPVIIDTSMEVLKFDGNIITGINIVDDILMWTDNVNEPKKINITRCKLGSPLTNVHTSLIVNGEGVLEEEIQVVVSVASIPVPPNTAAATNIIEFSDTSGLEVGDQLISLQTSGGGILNFVTSPGAGPQLRYITDIAGNVVTLSDDIFTGGSANWIVGNNAVFHRYKDIKEENITVIKKRPSIAPKVNVVKPTGQGVFIATCELSQNNEGNFLLQSGDTGYIRIPRVQSGFMLIAAVFYAVGDVLLLKQISTSGALPTIQELRCKVTNITTIIGGPGYTEYEVEIISINNNLPTTITTFDGPNPPSTGVNLDSGLEMNVIKEIDTDKRLFETKFVRFGTRWKYEDGEYSAFSPFSDVAFKGSTFSFHPTKDNYNLGMENNCDSIKLTHLVTPDMPEDVVQIDILFKLENSATIYSLESIKPNDPLPPGELFNSWNQLQNPIRPILSPIVTLTTLNLPTNYQGQYIVSTENIYAALPSNQLLRPWDNVPKKALAQEITGNRLVYGNYTQGYNMLDGTAIAKPYLELDYRQRSFLDSDDIDFQFGKKSLKTFRTYQLGVVYGDEYGRETPILTSPNASLTIPWDSDNTQDFNGNASRSTQLTAIVRGTQPDFATYYKFFIKQTSGEYYNLSMDSVYRAEDNENLWISFPSADANKIQKDEYIILKKQAEVEEQTKTNNKFKVVDIKNEVPEWIKYKRIQIGNVGGSVLVENLFPGYSASLNIPEENQNQIIINKNVWVNNGGTSLTGIDKDFEYLEMQFTTQSGTATIESKRYRIVGIELINSNEEYKITTEKLISSADNWVTTTPTSGIVEPNLRIKILKIVPKTSSAEFQGRFFVKIISNNVTQTYLEPFIGIETLYRIDGIIPAHNFADTQALPIPGADHLDGIVNSVNTNTPTQLTTALHNELKSNTRAAWEKLYEYGGTTISPTEGWFIDHCYFASAQPINASDLSGQTGYLPANKSGRMMRGGGSAGPDGRYFVDSCMGVLDIDGIGAYNSIADITVNSNSSGGWGGRTWSYQSKGQNNEVAMGSGPGDNTYDDIYDNSPGLGIGYMHLSFGPVGDNLWIKDPSAGSNTGLGILNNISFNWQNILAFTPLTSAQLLMQWQNQYAITFGFWGQQTSSGFNSDPVVRNRQWTIQDPDQRAMSRRLKPGAKFKFVDNEEIFTIEKTSVKRLYSHTPFMETQKAWDGINQVETDLNNSVEYAWIQMGLENPSGAGGVSNTIANINDCLTNLANKLEDFGHKSNRRLLYILKLDKDPNNYGISFDWDADSSHSIRFIEAIASSKEDVPVVSPAIWETEQKDDVDLNIYNEASNAIPIRINTERSNSEMYAPVGSRVWCSKSGSMPLFAGLAEDLKHRITDWDTSGTNYNIVEFASPGLNVIGTADLPTQTTVYVGKVLRFYKPDGSFSSAQIYNVQQIIGNYVTKVAVYLSNYAKKIGLSYYDCICFGNGVESNRIRDDFNAMTIGRGVKASTVFEGQYKEENRNNGLIYSGIYNSTSGVNNLNQFIQAEKITKDLNPTYGSIQKLFQRRIDLVSFCEDRVVKVMSNKDALYNADGNSQLIATNRVLGDANPFVGDYGISKDPASFAKESYRAYFTDKQRGAVLRLSMDGLTPISNIGMRDYFRDNLRNAGTIVASYDDRNKDYNLTLNNATISFNEDTKGWTSFKSFIQENGISVANNYYTFDSGQPWLHHASFELDGTTVVPRNNFYGTQFNSSIRTLLNDQPQVIKSYNTLNYEGDDGWICDEFITDQQRGTVLEFIEKEGKWFNYIRGTNEVDLQAFNFQGIGQTIGIEYSI